MKLIKWGIFSSYLWHYQQQLPPLHSPNLASISERMKVATQQHSTKHSNKISPIDVLEYHASEMTSATAPTASSTLQLGNFLHLTPAQISNSDLTATHLKFSRNMMSMSIYWWCRARASAEMCHVIGTLIARRVSFVHFYLINIHQFALSTQQDVMYLQKLWLIRTMQMALSSMQSQPRDATM